MTSSSTPHERRHNAARFDTQNADRTLPPAETLELITHDTRRAIVLALWAADGAPLEFSTLRREAGTDESARFNYHLQRLVGACVRTTDAGYELTPRGEQFVRAVSSVPPVTDLDQYDRAAAD